MRDTITLEYTGYVVSGTAYLTMWGGGEGTIEMQSYWTADIEEVTVLEGINDNGFGVQSIDGADCFIEKVYGGSYREYMGEMVFRDGKCTEKSIEEV